MRWSFKVARIGGIEVRIHVTFFLLLAVLLPFMARKAGLSGTLKVLILFLLVFLCVLLHEFGHAFAAKAYGIRTVDITLLPIGGVARMERMPEKPAPGIGRRDCWSPRKRGHCECLGRLSWL